MSSWESIEDTNSLFIKRPVGTLIVLIVFLRLGMETGATGQDMTMDELEDQLSALCNGRLLGDYRPHNYPCYAHTGICATL